MQTVQFDKLIKEHQQQTNDYQFKEIVGKGAYGEVYRATHVKTGIDVAIKYIKISDTKSVPLLRAIAREIEIMYRLTKISRNYFTVKLHDAFLPAYTKDADKLDSLYLVMDFTEYNLQKLYDSETKIQNEHVETLMYNILCALNFLSTSNVMHRDLKPSNILITPECNVKICDFGMARTIEAIDESQVANKLKRKRNASPVSFTRIYRPPEAILQCAKQTSKADLWSFGCIAAELVQLS